MLVLTYFTVKKFGACTLSVEVVLSHDFTTSDSGVLEKL